MILGSRVRIHLELLPNVHFEYVFLGLAKKILSLEWLSIMFFGGMESRLSPSFRPTSIISKISLEDFLSQENLCHWTSERDCKPAQQWIQHERSISSNTCRQEMSPNRSLLNQTSSPKIYYRNTKGSSRCWPRGLDL